MIRALAVASLLAVVSPATLADRLHLEGGGVIETDSWWIAGSLLLYESNAGTIGISRSAVLKIEPAPEPDGAADPPRAQPLSAESARRLESAKEALGRRDFEAAADLYRQALMSADVDAQTPRVGYALSQISLGEDELALGVVLDGLARDPHQPALLELLGDLRDRDERVADALGSWRAAFERAPSDRLRQKIERAERELHVGRDYDVRTTSHFNLRYDGDVDEALGAAVRLHLEEQFWRLAEELDHTPRQPITVLLYPKQDFREVTQSAEWVGGLYDGKIRVPLGGLKRLDPVAAGVLNHELTHAILHAKTHGNCPRWLHEGLAQRFEGLRLTRAQLQQVTEELAAGDAASWESRGFSYPLALSLTQHLEEQSGFDRVVDLLDELGRGAELDTALRSTYGFDYPALCRSWSGGVLARQNP